jgi:cellobiose-specific phosphotransferase system component IIB
MITVIKLGVVVSMMSGAYLAAEAKLSIIARHVSEAMESNAASLLSPLTTSNLEQYTESDAASVVASVTILLVAEQVMTLTPQCHHTPHVQ